MKLKIHSIKSVPTKYGNDLMISQVGVYENRNGILEYVKNITLNDRLSAMIKGKFIEGDFELGIISEDKPPSLDIPLF